MSSSHLKNISRVLAAASQEVVFAPTPEMRRAKAAFWASLEGTPSGDLAEHMTLAAASSLGADKKLSRWWAIPGFSDWWQNREEFKQRLEYLAQLALDSLEGVLSDPDANATARVNSAKLVLEAANKMPKRAAEEDISSRLAAMSRNELEEYVRTRMSTIFNQDKYLTPAAGPDTVTNVAATKDESGASSSDSETRPTRSSFAGSAD
jgi:hypothetical protein